MSEENVSESGVIRVEDEPVVNFHTLLIALYPLFGLYAHNLEKTPVGALVRPIIVLAIFSFFTIIVCRRLLADRDKGSVGATVVVAAIFSGWSVLLFFMSVILPLLSGYPDWLYYAAYTVFFIVVAAYASTKIKRGVARTVIGVGFALAAVLVITDLVLSAVVPRGHAWFIMAYAILTFAMLLWIRKSDRDFRSLNISLNWFGAILIGLSLLNIYYNQPTADSTMAPPQLEAMPEIAEDTELPDIYCIVVGGRGRSDVNQAIYNIDDTPFREELETLGMSVVENSLANYPNLLYSMSSSLNMDYLQELPDGDALTSLKVADCYHNNRVITFLEDQGYKVIVGAPTSGLLEPRDHVDESITPDRTLSEFEIVLLENSALSPLVQAIHFLRRGSVAEIGHMTEHGRVYQLFDRLGELPAEGEGQPRFVLAVMPIPEAPFLFDADGGWPKSTGVRTYAGRPEFTGDSQTYKENYAEQLAFTDRATTKLIERIANDSKRPAVVVLMSAHGPSASLADDHNRLDLRERFSTFLAIGSFGEAAPTLNTPKQLSLVNVFRLVMNDVFGAALPPLEDNLYLLHGDDPITFEAVTRPAE